MFEAVNEFVTTHASSMWVLPIVFTLCVLDGFFPPLPSESVVVALAAISVAVGDPNLLALFAVSAVGAAIGDNIAYTIGRHGLDRLGESPRPRVRRTFEWASRELRKRAAVIIMSARYIPVGRVAVNITAGATHYPRPRFVLLDVIAATSWASYSIALGALAGHWLEDNPLLAAALAVTGGVLLGLLVDRILQRYGRTPVADAAASEGAE